MKAFSINPQSKAYVYASPINMACGFPKLTEIANKTNVGAKENCMFIFCNKKMNYVKILWWKNHGYCIFAKRLVHATFARDDISGKITIAEMERFVNEVVILGAKRKRLLKAA